MDLDGTRGCCGRLPAQAPLANPFVPWQPESQEQYTAKMGLIRGTIYPCLDLPFMDMVNTEEKTETRLHQLQALGFAVQELGLYLDTHGEDEEAAELFRQYSELYHAGMKQYEEQVGPLFQSRAVQNNAYTWNLCPWPWEYQANEEA